MRISSHRFLTTSVLTTLACGAAFAASMIEPATYVTGNIAGVSANAAGSLNLSSDLAMVFRAGKATVQVPYAGISKTELGAAKSEASKAPLYKIWKKMIPSKTESLTVAFKNEAGVEQKMTLQMADSAASATMDLIETHRSLANSKAKPGLWWGDEYWKTTRNAAQWDSNSVASK